MFFVTKTLLIVFIIVKLILMDMNYSNTTTGEEGLELLAKVRVFCPAVPVILITAWGSINLAVQGIRAGAFDFITKPWNNLALLKTIETAIQLRDSEEKNPDPKNGKTERTDRFDKIIDEDWLEQERSRTEGTIMRYLSKGKKSYIARCQRCGRILPVGYTFKICDPCFHHSSIID